MRRTLPLLVRASLLLTLACACLIPLACGGSPIDIKQALQITEPVTGWYDAGIVNGQNKLVPTIAFRVKNSSSQPLTYVSLNAVFRVINDPEELGSALLKGIGGDALAPGAASDT